MATQLGTAFMSNPPDYPKDSFLGALRDALLPPHGNAMAHPSVESILAQYSPPPSAENVLARYSLNDMASPTRGSLHHGLRSAPPPLSPLREPEVPKELRRDVAWRKIVKSADALWARDRFNNLIYWPDYGKLTDYGWHIDHYPVPECDGGRATVSNIEALHWWANTALGGPLAAARKG
jgi:hypothetical protein